MRSCSVCYVHQVSHLIHASPQFARCRQQRRQVRRVQLHASRADNDDDDDDDAVVDVYKPGAVPSLAAVRPGPLHRRHRRRLQHSRPPGALSVRSSHPSESDCRRSARVRPTLGSCGVGGRSPMWLCRSSVVVNEAFAMSSALLITSHARCVAGNWLTRRRRTGAGRGRRGICLGRHFAVGGILDSTFQKFTR